MNLPTILEAADRLGSNYEYLLPVAPTLSRALLEQQIGQRRITLVAGIPSRTPAFARRYHRQRHGHGRGGHDGNTIRHGLSRVTTHVPARQAAH